MFVIDGFGAFIEDAGAARLARSRSILAMRLQRARRDRALRISVLVLLATTGMMMMISAERSHLALSRRSSCRACRSTSSRAFPRDERALDRGGAQILRPRRARLGHAALRRLDGLRLRRHHQFRHAGAAVRRWRHGLDRSHHRHRLHRRRPCLQGLGGAVPHVDARRL